ncbi:MAG: UDP-N-acetylglucosamine 2-epimerase (non-hydrolyzing) [Desulfobacula sp.]|nr:UDP-N-acetylglucosamine 2-epimerase (non-hydrolyzing) [Desulfobacula sp.]
MPDMKKIVTIIGARPQFIKAATLSRAIKNNKNSGMEISEIIVHTGQHYDENMSKIFFDELEIPQPDYNLEVGSGSHGSQSGKMMEKIEEVLLHEKPDLVLTYGDTNSTMAGAVAAVKLHIPSAHVEAGLRSFNRLMPEEINRIMADEISQLLFCPTQTAVLNLSSKRIMSYPPFDFSDYSFNSQFVFNVGDVMYDSVLFNRNLSNIKSDILARLGIGQKEYVLATLHRAENTDDPKRLGNIMKAFNNISANGSKIILPLHPRTLKHIKQINDSKKDRAFNSNVMIIDPVGYLDMLQLEANADSILTDSGGVQKEAFFLKIPCITLRDETEWVETVETGWNSIAGADIQKIELAHAALKNKKDILPPFHGNVFKTPSHSDMDNLYGDGHAAEKILEIISKFLLQI